MKTPTSMRLRGASSTSTPGTVGEPSRTSSESLGRYGRMGSGCITLNFTSNCVSETLSLSERVSSNVCRSAVLPIYMKCGGGRAEAFLIFALISTPHLRLYSKGEGWYYVNEVLKVLK
ncbi:hypothetical protein Trydic_g15828 [Trypoxylus dichotomus]